MVRVRINNRYFFSSWEVRMKRNQGYDKRTSRRRSKDSSLSIALILIISALTIVTVHKAIFNDKYEMAPSYGSQDAAYTPAKEQAEAAQQSDHPVGTPIDEFQGVIVYSNGTNYMSSHGLNFSEDGYYYGYKWQCVEFVKRFYYLKFGHKMPDGAGNAKYFFNPMLEQGAFNEQRGLYQYHNGGDVKPQVNDLLVFTDGAYGHVAIISEVGKDWLEVIQQNSEVTREKYKLEENSGKFLVSGEKHPAGWLRI
jgi:surface antigen